MGGLRRGRDHRTQIGERHRLVMGLDLANRREFLDEMSQAELVEIDVCRGLDRLDAHR